MSAQKKDTTEGADAAAGPASSHNHSHDHDGSSEQLGSAQAGISAEARQSGLSLQQVEQLLTTNSAIQKEYGGRDPKDVQAALNKLEVSELLARLSIGNKKNSKDMDSYKFWNTQPVIRFDETAKPKGAEGVIKPIEIDKVAKQPRPLMDGFEWVVMDLLDPQQLSEVQELLSLHYVEDDDAQFRLLYCSSFLKWALMSPGWTKDWHIGVRASKSQKLVAFISGVPCQLLVRGQAVKSSEVNFLCVHKKLRSKRLTPVLIEEITRQCYLKGTFQAVYTAGIVIPTPISTCRYFHRSLNWKKLYDCRFAGLPTGSTEKRQIARYKMPDETSLPGFREMRKEDLSAVKDLLQRYLSRCAMAPEFSEEEVNHWLLHDESTEEQVVWSYVVEDPKKKKITDFMSFYLLESSVIGHPKHKSLRAAYMFYYASEAAFGKNKETYKLRLNELVSDTLIMAKKANFDVFNALTLLDNPLFLEEQKFQPGDGKLNYYLFNYRTAPIPGGINDTDKADVTKMGGVGLVML